MAIRTVLFDLDGTLLPMELELFTGSYLKKLAAKLAPFGYQPQALIETVVKSTYAVIKNDGSQTNEELFWRLAAAEFGDKIIEDKPVFDEFYAEEFDSLRSVCGFNPRAAETIRSLKARGFRVILATNPIFPAAATERRIRWAGLSPEDFELVTTYENSRFCKPSPEYYQDILEKFSLCPEQCLMVGNDVSDDMSAQAAGINVFLLTDCLINTVNADISLFPRGSWDDLEKHISALS